MRRRAGGGGRLFTLLPFAPVMGAPVLRRLFARLPFATIPFMFIYKEDSFSDVIRRKAAQKAALLFSYSRPPQAGTFSYKSPAAGRLLSALQAPYQSAARAPLFYTVPFPLFAKKHGSVRPSRRFFIPCLFLFLSKSTVAFALHAALFTVPFPLFAQRHGSIRSSCRSFYRAFSTFCQKAR